ncbi:hypothetical protein [Winogradskyella wichelsiae]|uniref:hypothetical protein n=1 Tax=Winogradskyella wichelsiae TaxID=2697007 RepID=UPI0015CED2F3|nr:hypothetical protein [Winogradskyella wichelsiae]
MELYLLLFVRAVLHEPSDKTVSILSIGLIVMIILWFLLFLKYRKLKEKVDRLEAKV